MDLAELGPETALIRAEQRAGKFSQVRASGSLQVLIEGGSFTARGILLYSAPDSLRVEVQAFLGTTLARALLLEDWMEVHLPQENLLYEGRLSHRSLRFITGVPLDGSALQEVLLGPAAARDLAVLAGRADSFDLGPGTCRIGIPMDGGSRLVYRLDDHLGFQSTSYLDAQGRVVWKTEYREWKRTGEGMLPTELVWSFPRRDVRLTWRVDRRTDDPRRRGDDFRLDVPDGVYRLPVGPIVPPGAGP